MNVCLFVLFVYLFEASKSSQHKANVSQYTQLRHKVTSAKSIKHYNNCNVTGTIHHKQLMCPEGSQAERKFP